MVFKLQFSRWGRSSIVAGALVVVALVQPAQADPLSLTRDLYKKGQYFLAARNAFGALEGGEVSKGAAYSWITLSLVKARLFNSASYFFIRTLQTKNRSAIRRVLTQTETLVFQVGGDILRKYLVRYSREDDYDAANLSAAFYLFGKEALLENKVKSAVQVLGKVDRKSPLRSYALQLRGTAYALAGKTKRALADFQACADGAEKSLDALRGSPGADFSQQWLDREQNALEDLQARCQAGVARSHYQRKEFVDADRAYDEIPKVSFIWTDILFEQAWNAFSRREYNRTLGKLVTYKNPALRFVFNSEVDVLRAQTYTQLCLYGDANRVINEFNRKRGKLGKRVKRILTSGQSIRKFYELGRKAVRDPLHKRSSMNHLLNRFVRSPYFQQMVATEEALSRELEVIRYFDTQKRSRRGLPGFLREVLKWRKKTIYVLGGAFVKNSLADYYSILINDFEKMAFIKLEVLRRSKDELLDASTSQQYRVRGNIPPSQRDDQMWWRFNGEFWADEIGDYVFALDSRC